MYTVIKHIVDNKTNIFFSYLYKKYGYKYIMSLYIYIYMCVLVSMYTMCMCTLLPGGEFRLKWKERNTERNPTYWCDIVTTLLTEIFERLRNFGLTINCMVKDKEYTFYLEDKFFQDKRCPEFHRHHYSL